ncbi:MULTISPECIES: ThuA domain-containing protein [unclassified Microbacterium]|uniref:ThuA domain-containing protein n=1 Tax=unclassified Microbacterium TaxID=2609290 RepID=UPI000EA8AFC7|nr:MULTISPECIES: ThuA domain-containing protein [unclassified Microbacterium]MBT2484407.1 ThuA domain-containing protein [Microbacterium sp. ISL-108]RKN67317.1 ThuA domain-containing protein [Microbacterium sp. CGR2]
MTDPGTARRVVIVSGADGHADPWHALDATSAAIADVVSGVGDVRIATTIDPSSWGPADLLVLNVSGDLSVPPSPSGAQVDAIEAHHRAGGPILAMHSSSLAFRDDERWFRMLGGRWVPGVSMHPQIGNALIQTAAVETSPSGMVAFPGDFFVYDERYTSLDVRPHVQVLARHTEDGTTYPLVWWTGPTPSGGPVVYDALGHGVESFESAVHAEWLAATAGALLTASEAHR